MTLPDSQKDSWRNADRLQKVWLQIMNDYAPTLMLMKPSDITSDHVRVSAKAIWKTKQRTALKLIQIIRRTLDFGRVSGALPHDARNVAVFENNLDIALRKDPEMRDRHYASMPYDDVPAFYAELKQLERNTAMLLRFVIALGLRANEGARARWEWVDFDAGTYTVPASAMKTKKAHTLPLNAEALSILKAMRARAGGSPAADAFVFPGKNKLHVAARSIYQLVPSDYTTHGFRASLRQFLANETDTAFEVAEAILSHSVGSKVSRDYLRENPQRKMGVALQQWSDYIDG